MYIKGKYWENYIGDTDDSLTLVEYLAGKGKEEITVGEIFSDFGVDQLNGDFRAPEEVLAYADAEGREMDIQYAISLLTDLAAILLECKVSGNVNLCELFGSELETEKPVVRVTASPKEHELIQKILKDFAENPLAYDLSEMCDEDEMVKMAGICEGLRRELYD